MPRLFIGAGYPIRRSPAELARQLTGAYRSLATSFIGPQRLGIHRAPLVALTTIPLPPQRVVGIPQVIILYSLVNVPPAFPPGLPAQVWLGRAGPWNSPHKKAGPVADRRHSPGLFYPQVMRLSRLFCNRTSCVLLVSVLYSVVWWSRGDSNPRHPPCKGGALPAELRPHLSCRWWAMVDSNHRPRSYQDRALTS